MNDEKRTIDMVKSMFALYLKTSGTSVFITAVVYDADAPANPLYVRGLELLHDTLSDDSYINAQLDDAQRQALDAKLTGAYLRDELRIVNDRSPTDRAHDYYGVLLFECDDIQSHLFS